MSTLTTVEVSADSADRIRQDLAKIVRKAEKLDMPVPTYTEEAFSTVRPATREERELFSVSHMPVEMVRFVVTGEAPRLNGWSLVAQLDHKSVPGETLVRRAPGYETLSMNQFLGRQVCEHCGHNRARHETLVFVHENGELIQVGRNCAADFLRSDKIEGMLRLWESIRRAGEDEESLGGSGQPCFPTLSFLSLVLWVYNKHGFLGTAKAAELGKMSTKERVLAILGGDLTYRQYNEVPAPGELATNYTGTAMDLQKLLGSLPENNDFQRNLKLLSQADYVTLKNAGIMAAAACVWQRHLEDEAKKALVPVTNARHFDGEVGKRVKKAVDATVEAAFSFDNFYGRQTFVKMLTQAGERLVWKTSSYGPDAFKPGEKVTLTAFTIKNHGDYKGEIQTEISRANVVFA